MTPNELFGGITVTSMVAAITAIGALGMAASGLVDATKFFSGGISNMGLRDLDAVLVRFASALDRAVGKGEWRTVVNAHWINGRPRDEQKAIMKSLIRLGLSADTAPGLANVGNVDEKALVGVAEKLKEGAELDQQDINVLGRLDATVEAHLDAAFDRADQRYRNAARLLAGILAVALALLAAPATGMRFGLAALVGVLAVPLAPVAKDLTSSLQAAATALKAARGSGR